MTATSARHARQRRGAHVPRPAATPEAPARPSAPARPLPRAAWAGRTLSLEALLYGGIFLIAVLTRFWDLGRRALHHDESLHAQYSWMLAVGKGYIHDPLMHGPFLFHANALIYLLFGANDATSRLVPAATGCLLVLLPVLLRKEIGRWGALFASVLLLISPGFLYYSRFIRHDIYTATATLLLFAAIIRYIDDRRPRWVYLGALALVWAITNHEITFAVIFIDVTFLGAIIAWRLSPRLAGLLAVAGAVMGATALVLPRVFGLARLPEIPWKSPSSEAIAGFIGAFFTNPMVLMVLVEGLITLVALVLLLRQIARENIVASGRRQPAGAPPLPWLDQLFATAKPGSTTYAVYSLLWDSRTLWGGVALFFVLFAFLFTTMFANLPGLLSGMFGALGYWLGQHDVRRGEQPWFYYLILLPQYEVIAVILGGVMSVVTAVRVAGFWLGRVAGSARLYTEAFLLYWGIVMFAVLSWAGEKMPWLITHASLPFIMLAACLLGELVERLVAAAPRLDAGGMAWGSRHRGPLTAGYVGLVLAIAAVFTYGAGAASAAQPPQPLPVLPALVALVLATAGFGLLVGYRRAGLVATLALAGVMALAQVRFCWISSFENGDIPREQLIYVQTSPDVTRVTAEIERLSQELTGGNDINIIYDGAETGVVWPFEWYLRDFKNKRFMPNGPTSDPGPDVPVILLGSGNRAKAEQWLGDYEPVDYVLRWHYPEEDTYRNVALAPELKPGRSAWRSEDQPHGLVDILASLGRSLSAQRDPAEQAKLWRYLMYRQTYAPLGSANFTLFVRKDIVRYYNALRY